MANTEQMVATAQYVRSRIQSRAGTVPDMEVTKGVRGVVTGTLNKHMGGDGMRRVSLSWLFAGDFELITQVSSKTLSESQVVALFEWIDSWQDEDMVWHVGESFAHEAICVLNAAIRAYNMSPRADKIKIDIDPGNRVINAVQIGDGVLSKIDKKGDG